MKQKEFEEHMKLAIYHGLMFMLSEMKRTTKATEGKKVDNGRDNNAAERSD